MKTYIALLRGINVSGQKKIIMADLRNDLTEARFQNVRTYIQSGNILFDSTEPATNLAEDIQNLIAFKYGFEVPVTILLQSDFKKIANGNPFLKEDPGIEIKQLYVCFLATKPAKKQINLLTEKYNGKDLFIIKDQIIYLRYLNGAGKTKLTNKFMETQLKLSATTRNWKTTLKC